MPVALVQSTFSKAYFKDPARRIFELVDRYEIRLNKQFLAMIMSIKDELVLKELEQLIIAGRWNEAYSLIEKHVSKFAGQVNSVFTASAEDTATMLGSLAVIDFDRVNYRAVNIMRQNRLELVREFMDEQRTVVRNVMTDAISQGMNPRQQAVLFRDSIGLTAKQERAVANYQSLLESNSAEALTRQLRDRRFDPSITRAIELKEPLSPEHIKKMVDRYRERYIQYRSETIARTEAMKTVHQGSEEMYQQAFERGVLDPTQVVREWSPSFDIRTRDHHLSMSGQQRGVGEPFTSGLGNALMFPGDPSAPAIERVNCRCAVTTRMRRK